MQKNVWWYEKWEEKMTKYDNNESKKMCKISSWKLNKYHPDPPYTDISDQSIYTSIFLSPHGNSLRSGGHCKNVSSFPSSDIFFYQSQSLVYHLSLSLQYIIIHSVDLLHWLSLPLTPPTTILLSYILLAYSPLCPNHFRELWFTHKTTHSFWSCTHTISLKHLSFTFQVPFWHSTCPSYVSPFHHPQLCLLYCIPWSIWQSWEDYVVSHPFLHSQTHISTFIILSSLSAAYTQHNSKCLFRRDSGISRVATCVPLPSKKWLLYLSRHAFIVCLWLMLCTL